jgi:hypothetical protein
LPRSEPERIPLTGTAAPASFKTPAPWSHAFRLGSQQKAGLQQALAAKGVRALPFPFASALSIVSDVDDASRACYDAYVGLLVRELGLDFGDSTWLTWQTRIQREGAWSFGPGLGFFANDFSDGAELPSERYDRTRTLNESVGEWHLGNLDHWHAFLGWGPRVLVSELLPIDGRTIVWNLETLRDGESWGACDAFPVGICLLGPSGERFGVRSVSVRDKAGNRTSAYRPAHFDAPEDGRTYRLFAHSVEHGRAPLPSFEQIGAVAIELEEPASPGAVARVLVASALGDVILDRLRLLRDRYNVEMGLVTEHVGLHFRSTARAKRFDDALREAFERAPGLEGYNGSLLDSSGRLIFSTDAEDPRSLCRVFPELAGELEVRFVVPHAASTPGGWDMLDVVTPTPTRVGQGLYWAQRSMPNVTQPPPGQKFDGLRSRRDTFSERVTRALHIAKEEPGRMWPIYTHLGRDGPSGPPLPPDRDGSVPEPYLDPGPLQNLQDRTFNISGRVPASERIWVTRASGLYDYALMARAIGPAVERKGGDTILIRSWFDPVIEKTLPRSPAQLYGLTFYVDDPKRATVAVDDRPVLLFRNRPDETGRPSVTIAEAESVTRSSSNLTRLAKTRCLKAVPGVGRRPPAGARPMAGLPSIRARETARRGCAYPCMA